MDTSQPQVGRVALVRPEANDDIGEVRVVSREQAAPVLEPEDLYPACYCRRGSPRGVQSATQLPEAD